jgi:hypothetical protein
MYHLLATPESSSILGSWERACGAFTEVLGYPWFGSIFLRNPGTHEYLVLHPLLYGRNAQDCGRFGSVAEFEETVLRDQGFVRDFLRPADLASLEARLGPPAALQVSLDRYTGPIVIEVLHDEDLAQAIVDRVLERGRLITPRWSFHAHQAPTPR